eukprot:CAMPEP_0168741154 /NCGR_PEP_ID=MMETSP0724-20121128/12359_1 /TAXON_ID=265536 /ORGANISM="Amphiprora sp., Strain CCMP467" /LENGTH=236 /DNA_ID=CAMNT_0008788633 /DNA_START=127 /DNA_END=835 /DNA_ORIENTATION=+
MQLSFILSSLFESSNYISHGKFGEASQRLVGILRVLQTTRVQPDHHSSLPVNTLRFLPISRESRIGCPDWNEEFFRFPFAVLAPETLGSSNMITEPIAAALAGVCFFLLGLCHHINSSENKRQCPETSLRSALSFYEHAWRTISQLDTDQGGFDFLQMAICTNTSNCCYRLGQIEASNEWQAELDEILFNVPLKDDDLTLELHDFFMMTSAAAQGLWQQEQLENPELINDEQKLCT